MSQPQAPSAISATLDSLLTHSATGMRNPDHSMACCCGRESCAYLEHNNTALEGLERDLQNAAQIGQALLARHETYMNDAEEERRKMGDNINKLEADKKELEAANARTIEENRYLLDQLEQINNSVSDADAQILSLNTTLESTSRELGRLTALADRASSLETQLLNMEKEQVDLQQQLSLTEAEGRTAIQRWKGAERTVGALQEQVDRMEREAREERARHAEVMARFERRRAVDSEPENAASRLKGAAAATIFEKNGSNTVVSHFVKDILQDNANLQMGIVELREMLMGSNEEVQNLREQMMLHQPVRPQPGHPETGENLCSEMARTPATEATPDLHVHHHYHAAPKQVVREKPALRRPRKNRNVTSPGFRTPILSGSQTPRTPVMRPTATSSAATILSQTSVSIPPPSQPSYSRRWSAQSSQAPPSVAPSSLPSPSHYGSIFDGVDDEPDSSRPTSPSSTTLGSPGLKPWHSKRGSDVSMRSMPANSPFDPPSTISGVLQTADRTLQDDIDDTTFPLLEHSTILEEPEDDAATRPSSQDTSPNFNLDEFTPMRTIRPRLHRASSHESMLSGHGVDMPHLRSQRSQILGRRGFTPHTSFTSTASIGPVTSSTAAVGRPLNRQRGYDSSNYNRLLLSPSPSSPTDPSAAQKAQKATIGERMGGWMSGRWGVAPTKSGGGSKAKDALSAVEGRAAKEDPVKARKASSRLSTHVEPVTVDSSLLQETLDES